MTKNTSKKQSENQGTPPPLFDKPFALSMGPQRSGSSWLDRYLRSRGDICLPADVKEVFFFDEDFKRGLAHYTSHFKPEKQHALIMEISTTSFDHKDAPRRVFETFGKNLTLLCPIRHPIIRSYSLYLHYMRYGIVNGTLQEACAQNPQIIESSHYAKHLKNWQKHFNKDQIKLIFQEDLENNQEKYLKDACNALNIDFIPPSDEVMGRFNVTTYSKSWFLATITQNVSRWLRRHKLYFIVKIGKFLGLRDIIFGKENPETNNNSIPPEDRLWLEDQLTPEIKAFETLLGHTIPQWQEK